MSTAALAHEIAAHTNPEPGHQPYSTAIDGLTLVRSDGLMPPMPLIYKPAICLVAQGAKTGTFGSRRFIYRTGQALVVGIEMPGIGVVSEASFEVPYLGAIVEFDLTVMREVLNGLEQLAPSHDVSGGVFVADIDSRISDCVRRLVQLLDAPRAIPVLVPAIMRELCYWLLSGSIGGDVATIVFGVDRSPSVVAAIHELRKRFTDTIRIDELAMNAGMSPSAFHRIFKAMTSMTPLQYQKQLRLLKARNLMIDDATNAETAAYRVGYESPSQFSREYARMFGAPPHQDITRAGSATRVAATP